MDWFLYDNGHCHERVNKQNSHGECFDPTQTSDNHLSLLL